MNPEETTYSHEPVMLNEIQQLMPLRPGDVYIDGTIGLGGHAVVLSEMIKPNGWMVGTDWDVEMLAKAKLRLASLENIHIQLVQSDFRKIPEWIQNESPKDFPKSRVKGILLDLGLNLAQIEDPTRGISFRVESPLDMRMDRTTGKMTASELLNKFSAKEIEQILWDYGDERWARKIAQVIVDRRKIKTLETTHDLIECVQIAIPAAKREKRIHPATRTFQAVRIAVNQELEGLGDALEELANCLSSEGVMVVLSYHSGEDRIVKNIFRNLDKEKFEVIYKRPLQPTEKEIMSNPKSRSAKMRAIRKKAG